jgi:NADPH:quinone reductase-like Zn-dependent oxidoreductase
MPKAFVFNEYGGPQVQSFVDLPKPTAGPGQLLIRVRAAGVNPVEWQLREGYLRGFLDIPLPAVPGSELAGVVEQVGKGVEGFAGGDEVFGGQLLGAFAEYAVLPAQAVAHKPARVSFVQAATLPNAGGAAYDALQQLDLKAGQKLLVLGADDHVGVAATQIARSRGVTVIGAASQGRRNFVESIGAVHVRDGEGEAGRIRAIVPGGVDAILDLVGPPEVEATAGLLVNRSKLVTTVDPVTASKLGGSTVDRVQTGERYAEVAALVEAGVLNPIVTTRPFDRAAEALAEVQTGRTLGEIVLEMS